MAEIRHQRVPHERLTVLGGEMAPLELHGIFPIKHGARSTHFDLLENSSISLSDAKQQAIQLGSEFVRPSPP
jgi:hypothetical protein